MYSLNCIVTLQSAPIDWEAIKIEHEIAQKARWAKCPTLIKDFYQEHPGLNLDLPYQDMSDDTLV